MIDTAGCTGTRHERAGGCLDVASVNHTPAGAFSARIRTSVDRRHEGANLRQAPERWSRWHNDGSITELGAGGTIMDTADVPPYHELLWPTLQAVTELGGSASIGEIAETVIKRQGFSDAQLAVLHNNGPGTEIGYRLAWARSYLKGMSLLTNSARGIWALTDAGTALVTDSAGTDSWRRDRVRELWQVHLVESRKAALARIL